MKRLLKNRMAQKVNRLRRKLRGWQKVSRERHLIAEKSNLSDGEFRLLELYRDLTDWDVKHIETYKSFSLLDVEVAELLKCDTSTVCRRRKALLSKGLISEKEDGSYEVVDNTQQDDFSDIAEVFLGSARTQTNNAHMQSDIAPLHKENAPVHTDRGYTTDSPLVSFKSDFVSLLPCDKYLELEKSGRFGAMTAEDMEFVEPSSREWGLVRGQILAR